MGKRHCPVLTGDRCDCLYGAACPLSLWLQSVSRLLRLAALNAPYACLWPLTTIADGVYCTDAYGRQRNILKDLGESIPWCLNDEKSAPRATATPRFRSTSSPAPSPDTTSGLDETARTATISQLECYSRYQDLLTHNIAAAFCPASAVFAARIRCASRMSTDPSASAPVHRCPPLPCRAAMLSAQAG